ncbi:MAG: type II toxin-antitoxin system RelE/ParE family toxin [Bacteroidetes bacterium]|nr:type II toxin-antitoxin system RelE/ParE family toxin [Bacteroidota bacterium]
MPSSPKSVVFLGSSLDDLRDFPLPARQDVGFQIDRVQRGGMPSDFKPMPDVGAGVFELRIRTDGNAHRVFYVAKFDEAVYILHAFEKKTPKTSKADLDAGRRRYAELRDLRANEHP